MKFTIITPSFNQLNYLKQCVASVRDQVAVNSQQSIADGCKLTANSSVTLHHHIQDAQSSDGTAEWLHSFCHERTQECTKKEGCGVELSFASEVDEGMYDAINKGVAFVGARQQAQGAGGETCSGQQSEGGAIPEPNSIISWLNCDEQYLPGTLNKVATFFDAHPDVDILFGGMLMVDEQGELLACRKAMPMRKLFLEASYLYNYSCAMFIRESFWKKLGGFDTSFKNAGDEDLIRRAMSRGVKSSVLDDYLASFVYGGNNLSSDPVALTEHEALKCVGSRVGRIFRLLFNLLRLTEKFLRGGHVQHTPVEYELYQGEETGVRSVLKSVNPSCRWPYESRPYLMSHRLSK